ncbi:methyl-accepting chemotaxis protein, partial [Idiomarina xiamenensis 10-D-4]
MQMTIKARVLSLALIPPILLAVFMTLYNLYQSRQTGDEAVSQFTQQMEHDRRAELANYLHLAKSAIQHLVNDESLGSVSERQQQAKQIIRQLRFNDAGDTGYLFIYDSQGVSVAHGVNAALEGKNLYDFQDPNGVYLIRGLIDAAQQGGGYVAYDWKAVDGSIGPKLAYAERIDKWDWVLGTGFWIAGLQQQASAIEGNVNNSIAAAATRTAIAAVIAVLVIAAIALLVVRSITAPLRKALDAMHNIADGDGDLTKRLHSESADELGELGGAFNRFADQVASMVSHIRSSANAMTESTQQLQQVMHSNVNGVSHQQQESEQVATAVNELATASHEVARSASEASQAAIQAEQLVGSAQQLLTRAVKVIHGLASDVEKGSASVNSLAEQSEKIGS